MAENKKPVQDQYEFANKLALAVYVIAIFAAGFYFIRFWGRGLSSDPEQWGQFGDYLGGVINPIVGVVTVLLIVVNIRMQREELRASLAELKQSNENGKRQSFETSFFSWLSNYSRLVESLRATDSKFGRAALRYWHERLCSESSWQRWCVAERDQYRAVGSNGAEQTFAFILSNPSEERYRTAAEGLLRAAHAAFSSLMKERGEELQPFLSTLEGLMSWVDTSNLRPEEKWHYAAIVRSQLSWLEKAFIFHRSVQDGSMAFARVINKYALLDQLDKADNVYLVFAIAFADQPPRLHLNNPILRPWPLQQAAFNVATARSHFAEYDEPQS